MTCFEDEELYMARVAGLSTGQQQQRVCPPARGVATTLPHPTPPPQALLPLPPHLQEGLEQEEGLAGGAGWVPVLDGEDGVGCHGTARG